MRLPGAPGCYVATKLSEFLQEIVRILRKRWAEKEDLETKTASRRRMRQRLGSVFIDTSAYRA